MSFFSKLRQSAPPPVIIVSGLPRSGTSMLMKMLDAAGIPILSDGIRAADEDNPRGYYEFERVKKLDEGDSEWLSDAAGKAVKVISALLRHLPPELDYRVIFVRRDLPEILASQRKMLLRRGEDPDKVSDEELTRLFEKHLAAVEQWLGQQSNFEVMYLHYGTILNDPLAAAQQVGDFIPGRPDVAAMAAVVDPELYRNRA